MTLTLDTSIEDLYLVGETYAEKLKKYLNIHTVEDLLFHIPFRYEDLSSQKTIDQLISGEIATVKGYIATIENIYTKTHKKIQKAVFQDQSGGKIFVTWFNQPYLINSLTPGTYVALAGKVDALGSRLQMTSPKYEKLQPMPVTATDQLELSPQPQPSTTHTGGLIPVYPETFSVSSKWLRSRIKPLIKQIDTLLTDWLPPEITQKVKLIDIKDAIKKLHFPESQTDIDKARQRLAFDELFLLQMKTQHRKQEWKKKSLRHHLSPDLKHLNSFLKSLPFKLTPDQNTSLQDIIADLNQTTPMNRLLEGDVGSGKTVVAAAAIFLTHQQKGLKTIIMAPTEVLANQHYRSLKQLLEPLGLEIGLYTGASKPKDEISQYDVYLGTHALLFQKLPHEQIGLVIIDEQHRFGVKQRGQIIGESQLNTTPHLLSMTATPIPRTVALTMYGDLSLSFIRTMPQGRKPIKTWVVPQSKRQSSYEWMEQQMQEHHTQIYFTYPLIDVSDSAAMTNIKAAKEEFVQIQQRFPCRKVGLLHGQMKSKEKQAVMQAFADHTLDILVSTSVIEVGIDVPNASIIVIEGAERFGLAQLHQLRGRVGRGEQQSYCLLFTTNHADQQKSRLKAMETTHSGLELAELDLRLRGPGELYGTMQSGYLDLKIASFNDKDLIQSTQKYARYAYQNLEKFPLLQKKLLDSKIDHIQPN